MGGSDEASEESFDTDEAARKQMLKVKLGKKVLNELQKCLETIKQVIFGHRFLS